MLKYPISFIKRQLLKEVYLANSVMLIGTTIYSSYYGIFLYRSTLNFKTLVVDALIGCFSIWIGMILGSIIVTKVGYILSMRIAFFLFIVSAFLTFIFASDIKNIYIIFSILRNIPSGMYGAITSCMLLREFKKERSTYFYLTKTISLVVSVFFPVLVGGFITITHGFSLTFLLASFIYLVGMILPMHYTKIPQKKIFIYKIKEITQLHYFKHYGLNRIVTEGADQINNLLFSIIPYLIIKSVFSVGILTSLIAITAALLSYFSRHLKIRAQIETALAGSVGRVIANILLVFYWTTPMLVIRSLIVNIISVYTDSATNNLEVNNLDKLLKKQTSQNSLEMNIIDSTLLFTGQCIALGIFLFLLSYVADIDIIEITIIIYAFWKVLNMVWLSRIFTKLSILEKEEPYFLENKL